MATPSAGETALIKEQIRKNQFEITFQNIVFSLVNCLSMLFIGYILFRSVFRPFGEGEDYSKFLTATVSLIIPYLTYVAQGFSYPKKRRISVLRHLLAKRDISGDDVKCIYEK
jgi:hypothetical protein